MRIIGDFHLHSKYSRATSKNLSLDELSKGQKIKGLNLLGTGDFTHPLWFKELKEKLVEEENGIYSYNGMKFILTVEIATISKFNNDVKRVHHNIHAPSIEIVEQINEAFAKFGKLASDGRPILSIEPSSLVETIMKISKDVFVYPNHAWTPWWSVFGSISGFDSLKDCYQDQTKNVFALETGLSCYDEETEVLTDIGWKKFPEVKHTDKICTLNIVTNKIEFQYPEKSFSYNYEGKMYRLKTKRIDLLVTPNHKLFVTTCDFRNPKPFFLKEAEFLFGKSKQFKKDGKWVGKKEEYFILPSVNIKYGSRYYSGFRKKTEKKIPMKDWLKFFGFWLAEGWTTKGKGGDYNVCISNTDKELISEMKQLLESFGYVVFHNEKIHTIRVRDYQLFNYLRQFGKCYEKFIPPYVKSLSSDALQILFDYYIKSDGHIYGRTNKGVSATTTSIKLRDDLQEIALKIGMSAYYKIHNKKGKPFISPDQKKEYLQRNDSWVIYFIRRNKHAITPSYIKKYNYTEKWVNFKGKVYCVSVPNKVLYVRRNGIPVWCGNSDPQMNWRLSQLDDITLLSNSDAHSAHPWRLGREANVFELKNFDYFELHRAIKEKDPKKILYTIEVDPFYGKYHFTGHRDCKVVMHPNEAKKINNICPVCKRKLTVGVLQRVEELADREEGFVPKNAIPFKSLLPLYEIISFVKGTNQLYSKKIIEIQDKLIAAFGNEMKVLLEVEKEEIEKIAGEDVADAIIKIREGKIKYEAGYDGVYGKPIFNGKEFQVTKVDQKTLKQFKRGL